MTLRFGSLFSGIGGLDLGLERAGMECAWQIERDPYCLRVLGKHWPDIPKYHDIKEVDLDILAPVDLICGGFPCQPVSLAGKRLAQADERWLWPEFFRIVRALRPRYVLVENVPGLLSAGLSDVLGDLAAGGYDAEWDCIPAAAVGAPHLRYRVLVVAYAMRSRGWQDTRGASGDEVANEGWATQDDHEPAGNGQSCRPADVAHPESDGRLARWPRDPEEVTGGRESYRGGIGCVFSDANRESLGWPTESRGQCGDWATEPDVGGTLDGFSSWLHGHRLEQAHMLLLAYGNATQTGPREILRTLRRESREADLQRKARGSFGLSAAAVLLAYLRQLTAQLGQAGYAPLESKEAGQDGVRGLRDEEESPSPSRRPGLREQRAGECPDSLQTLSRLLARHAEKAWSEYRWENAEPVLSGWLPGWEDGFSRIASSVPNRVDRLRSLGNAVVPQVAEWVGRRIVTTNQLRERR